MKIVDWILKKRGYWKTWKLSEFKYFEVQIEWRKTMLEWFYLDIETRTDCDHEGFYAGFALLKLFYIGFTFYDSRHKEDDNDEPYFDDYQQILICGNPVIPPTERAYYAVYYEDQDIIRIFWDWGGHAKPEGVYYDQEVGKVYKLKHLTTEGLHKPLDP